MISPEILAAKEKLKDLIKNISEVNGIGIGVNNTLRVYLEKPTKSDIPKEVSSFKVEIIITGKVIAF